MHLRQRILCNLLVLRLVTLLILGSCSPVREQARGHRGNVQEPTPDQLMSFPESEVFGFNKLENQDLFVRGHACVQANDANSQETKSEISLDMLVQGQKGEQHEIGGSDTSDAVIERHGSLDSKAQSGETLETQELTSVEAMDIDTGSADVGGERFSEPYFKRKLLRKEMGGDGYSYKFLDIGVHAVFIESGFGGINSISGTQVDGFRLPEEQASKNLVISLCYTLPELLGYKNMSETIVLKFQSLGHFLMSMCVWPGVDLSYIVHVWIYI
jgi:F-box protein 7